MWMKCCFLYLLSDCVEEDFLTYLLRIIYILGNNKLTDNIDIFGVSYSNCL